MTKLSVIEKSALVYCLHLPELCSKAGYFYVGPSFIKGCELLS